MTRLLNRIFYDVLVNFKFYRKKKGGRWYYVRIKDSAYGVHGPIEFWTQEPEEYQDVTIMKEEI